MGAGDEKRLTTGETIVEDDPTAISTAAGWARWKKESERAAEQRERDEEAVAGGRIWLCQDPTATMLHSIFVEAERWIDAQRVASLLLGGREVEVSPFSDERVLPRVQVRWEGSAARACPNLRLRIRRLSKRGRHGPWEDLA